MANFNNYQVSIKFRDLMDFLNQDFETVKTNIEAIAGSKIEVIDILPVPTVTNRGSLVYVANTGSVPDEIYICKKNADGTFAWNQLA